MSRLARHLRRRPASLHPLLLAAALLASLGLAAAAPFELAGLQLGMDRAAVLRAFPDLQLAEVAYADPLVGTDYALSYGRVAILRYEGRRPAAPPGTAGSDLELRLTGDDRLYLVATTVADPALTCAQASADRAALHGAPQLDERPTYALWQAPSMLGPRLEFHCLGDGLYHLELTDRALADDYTARLAAELQDAVDAAANAAPTQATRPPGLPPFLDARQH
jgi:hypothetical protein